ncbi:ATP-binding protein involved in chromosome partitioning [Pseudoalteromonas rubra]|uniref:Iron-sulfur cluster carrier protein n=1 Tax=Pseudoalteromonas rubra TaxID=43658 RepID=A0A8T0C7E8_9GAMM|nr:Mrp/NBP35 family ATP-binding protein [Pseudoalteromonas rubra]KAF7786318.1 ATP-binding protein involved in chromosome partitioning [Pseudoalteromonas rubra]
MFGIEKLFTRKDPIKEQIKTHLQHYRSAIFPMGIDPQWITEITSGKSQDGSWQVSLKLPFAASGQGTVLSSHLSDSLNTDIQVACHSEIAGSAQFKQIKHIVLVASGKGGVGKSTTAVNLAAGLASQGAQVGILDADIYGPSIPSLLGLSGQQPEAIDEKTLKPFEKDGIRAMSIGFLVPEDDATVWRGPMASQALTQLLNETAWGELDYLIVDMPPGTGDIQLTMTQKVPASGAIVVTTPQDLALADAQKGVAMFNKVNLPIIGLIENMSYFSCQHCGGKNAIFGSEGGAKLAARHGVPLLAEIPLDTGIRENSEQGANITTQSLAIKDHYIYCAQLMSSMLYLQSQSTQGVEILITDD